MQCSKKERTAKKLLFLILHLFKIRMFCFTADRQTKSLSSVLSFYQGFCGERGGSKNCYGANGACMYVKVSRLRLHAGLLALLLTLLIFRLDDLTVRKPHVCFFREPCVVSAETGLVGTQADQAAFKVLVKIKLLWTSGQSKYSCSLLSFQGLYA